MRLKRCAQSKQQYVHKGVLFNMSTEVLTSVPGNIWKVLVEVGDQVNEGDVLFIMEVMKSEVNHNAPISGTVIEVNISNDQEGVSPGTVAVVIE